MKTKQFIIGESSRRFLNVLNTYEAFRNDFLTLLQAEYGDDSGDKLYNSHAETLDAVEHVLWEYWRVPLTMEMGTDKDIITI